MPYLSTVKRFNIPYICEIKISFHQLVFKNYFQKKITKTLRLQIIKRFVSKSFHLIRIQIHCLSHGLAKIDKGKPIKTTKF